MPHVTGLVLKPFRGVRYAPDRVRSLASVTSPPYDLVDEEAVARFMAEEPHNVVRLILPQQDYGQAATTLQSWLSSGVLTIDTAPALYVYEEAGDDVLQRGLIGVLAIDDDAVLPHEHVFPGPVRDRLALMNATQANLDPIFCLYEGGTTNPSTPPWHPNNNHPTTPNKDRPTTPAPPPDNGEPTTADTEPTTPGVEAASEGVGTSFGGGRGVSGDGGTRAVGEGAASRLVDVVAGSWPPLLETRTGDGVRHRLWAVTDPRAHAEVAADLAARQALIADGHHRYATYRALKAAHEGSGPWDYGLALLVDSRAYPPRLGAIHRVVSGLRVGDAAKQASAAFQVELLDCDLPAAVDLLAAQVGTAFLLAGDGRLFLLTDPDPAQIDRAMPADASERWRQLDTAILHRFVIPELWGIDEDEADVRIVHHDADRAVRKARRRDGTAVIVNPLRVADVFAVAANGEKVPRKSTSFGPKPRTGLIMRTFETD